MNQYEKVFAHLTWLLTVPPGRRVIMAHSSAESARAYLKTVERVLADHPNLASALFARENV